MKAAQISSRTSPAAGSPLELGYTFPPEFAPQCATWFSWPRPEGISFPGKYHTVPENLTRIVHHIALRQDVHINVLNNNWARLVRDQLVHFGLPAKLAKNRVFFHDIKTNECWCRDHGPAFVVRGAAQDHAGKDVAIVEWGFNAWGGKYPPFADDDAVPVHIAKRAKIKLFHAQIDGKPVIMEGGSVEFNGSGTVISTTQCLLNKNRNPHLTGEHVERSLINFYGQRKVLWLSEGIEGDDTDGHVDDLVRFLDARTIVIAVEPKTSDANHKQLSRARAKLAKLTDQDGKAFNIVEIPMPAPVSHDGERLPATYINFLFIDGACLVPTFRCKQDKQALKILQKHLPNHEVVGIDCVELIWGLGAIHCLTQQVPKVPGLAERLRRIAIDVP
jgi:agmatine deiminase